MTEPTQVVAEIPATPAQAAPAATVTQPAVELGKDGTPFDAARAQKLIDDLREENKKNKDAAKKLADIEAEQQKKKDAELSDLEKEKKARLEAEEKLKASTLREMRRAAAEKVKLPAEFADRLKGETQEELDADAVKVLSLLPKQPALKTDATNPGGGSQVTETREQKLERLKGANASVFSDSASPRIVWPMQE